MGHSPQQTILTSNLKAQLEGVPVLPICLYGAPGIGKSSVIDSSARALGASNNTISISSVNYEFFSGIPSFSTDESLDKYSSSGAIGVQATIWTIPELIMSTNRMAEKNPNGVILHLEDLHTADKTTEAVMYQLLLDRKLGDYTLHPKVAIIASMNDSKESGGGHFNSAAVKSRLCLMPYEFNFQDWYDNFGRTLHPWISSFLKTNQQYITEPESKTLEPSGSARSYTKMSLDFEQYKSDEELLEVFLYIARGMVSANAAAALDVHVQYFRKLDFDSIVAKKVIPNLAKMPELDKVLWGYVVHSINTPADALYAINLINDLMSQPHYETIIGFIAGEIYNKHLLSTSGQDITPGQDILVSKILNSYDETKYTMGAKVKKDLVDAKFDNYTEVMKSVSKYIN